MITMKQKSSPALYTQSCLDPFTDFWLMLLINILNMYYVLNF